MIKKNFQYPQIDQKKTGEWLRYLCKHYGYTVKDIQEYLHISSNQAVYEWFNGKTLPSVNNLLALSMLFGIPVNALLVDTVHDVIRHDFKKNCGMDDFHKKYMFTYSMNIVRMQRYGA